MSCEHIALYVAATPIGNDNDVSPRLRETLESVSLVLAEDTRRAGLFCSRCGIRVKEFMSFHDHNEKECLSGILAKLHNGESIALISDAGTPLVADPGYRLVRMCQEEHLRVAVIPGPSAPIVALAGSGIAPQPFTFLGFLPRSRSDIEATLRTFAQVPTTLIFFERKDRLAETLAIAFSILGSRELCIARELTKTYEEYLHGQLESPPPTDTLLGEITVIIGPPQQLAVTSREDILALIAEERPLGGNPRDIARRVQVRAKGWTTKSIYAMMSAE